MKDLHGKFSVDRMAKYFKVSRAGFYRFLKWKPSLRECEDAAICATIMKVHKDHRGVYGIDRLHPAVREITVCGRKRIRRLMKTLKIQGRMRRKFRVMTTDSTHSLAISPNLLARKFRAEAPNRVFVSDITNIHTREGWLYLCVVLDLFSRKIVGWAMRNDLSDQLAIDALDMAIKRRDIKAGLIFHSDRGVQYASGNFRALLKEHRIVQSMSRKANCLDNACAESVFATIKTELIANIFWTRREARTEIFDYIETFYNRKRLHSYLGYMNPDEFERRNAA